MKITQDLTKKAITINGETVKDSQYLKGIEVEKEHKDIYDLFKAYLAKNNLQMPITEEEFYGKIAIAHFRENPEDYYPDGQEPYKLIPVDELSTFINKEESPNNPLYANKGATLSNEDIKKLEYLQKQLENKELTSKEMSKIESQINEIIKKD